MGTIIALVLLVLVFGLKLLVKLTGWVVKAVAIVIAGALLLVLVRSPGVTLAGIVGLGVWLSRKKRRRHLLRSERRVSWNMFRSASTHRVSQTGPGEWVSHSASWSVTTRSEEPAPVAKPEQKAATKKPWRQAWAQAEAQSPIRDRAIAARERCERLLLHLEVHGGGDAEAQTYAEAMQARVPETIGKYLAACRAATESERRQTLVQLAELLDDYASAAESHRQRIRGTITDELEILRRYARSRTGEG